MSFRPLVSSGLPLDVFLGNSMKICREIQIWLKSSRILHFIYLFKNIGTEYFKHGIYSPFFPLQNAVCFIILTYLVPELFTFYIQGVLKLKKINSGAKRLINSFKKTTNVVINIKDASS